MGQKQLTSDKLAERERSIQELNHLRNLYNQKKNRQSNRRVAQSGKLDGTLSDEMFRQCEAFKHVQQELVNSHTEDADESG